MSTDEIYQAELRRLIRNIGMKYASAEHKSLIKGNTFNLYHFGQAMAYQECLEIILTHFEDELKKDDVE
jgi:hypothetical protein